MPIVKCPYLQAEAHISRFCCANISQSRRDASRCVLSADGSSTPRTYHFAIEVDNDVASQQYYPKSGTSPQIFRHKWIEEVDDALGNRSSPDDVSSRTLFTWFYSKLSQWTPMYLLYIKLSTRWAEVTSIAHMVRHIWYVVECCSLKRLCLNVSTEIDMIRRYSVFEC